MFINKIVERPDFNPQKMSSYINSFLKTEVTCIPKLLNTYLGNYYNIALFNGATWVFLLWYLIHVIFDKSCHAFLKRLRYKEYVCVRLKNSLWYLGFFGTTLVYCGATLTQNEIELFNFKKMHVLSNGNLPMQVVLGYTLICTFYLHSALWEGLGGGNVVKMCNYFFLFAFMVSSYMLRIVEISFTLTALVSVAQVAQEFTRCCFMTSMQSNVASKLAVGCTYFVAFLIYLAIHIIVIPLTFVIPLGIKIISDYPNALLIFLFFNLVLWLMTEFYKSVVFQLTNHWLYHRQIKKELGESTEIMENVGYDKWCSSSVLECSLFHPRNDDSYNLMILREEIKARKNKMLSMRKPKNMFLQTLKCVVAIKRKLSERHRPDSSDSDSESDLLNSDNTDDEIAEEMQSEKESDNEESDSQEGSDTTIKENVGSILYEQIHTKDRYNLEKEEYRTEVMQTVDNMETDIIVQNEDQSVVEAALDETLQGQDNISLGCTEPKDKHDSVKCDEYTKLTGAIDVKDKSECQDGTRDEPEKKGAGETNSVGKLGTDNVESDLDIHNDEISSRNVLLHSMTGSEHFSTKNNENIVEEK